MSSSYSDSAVREALTDPDFRNRLYRYAASMCRCRADAEDVVQDTLAAALAKAHQLRDLRRITPWACRIARNVYLQGRRTSVFAPKATISLEDVSPAERPRVQGPAAKVEETLMVHRQAGAVWRALETLPRHYRIVVHLRDVHDFSTHDTAAALGLTIDATKTRLHRAHAMIRELCSTEAEATARATMGVPTPRILSP